MQFAYLTNDHPKVSHSLNRREIHALEQRLLRRNEEIERMAETGCGCIVRPRSIREESRTLPDLFNATPHHGPDHA